MKIGRGKNMMTLNFIKIMIMINMYITHLIHLENSYIFAGRMTTPADLWKWMRKKKKKNIYIYI